MYEFTAIFDNPGEAKKLQQGQKVQVTVKNESINYDMIIPNSAIIMGSGTQGYVFVLKERQKVLGTENYVEQVTVNVLDSDDLNSAVSYRFSPEDNIVSYSSRVLQNGSKVKSDLNE